MNALAIVEVDDVVCSHNKAFTALMDAPVKTPAGRNTSRMGDDTKALHVECLYYYAREFRQLKEARREVGQKPGTLGRIKDEGPVGASIRSTAPTGETETEFAVVVDMTRILLCDRAHKKLPDMLRKAIEAYYRSGESYKAVMSACRCGFDQARQKIKVARAQMICFYIAWEHPLG